jgi:hypothetical protein
MLVLFSRYKHIHKVTHMKKTLICFIIPFFVTACAAPLHQFHGSTVLIDNIPTVVSIIQIDDATYDVLSREEGVAISRIYSHKAFVNRDRYRRAAITVLQKRLGKRKQLTIIDDMVGVGGTGVWYRFKVTEN